MSHTVYYVEERTTRQLPKLLKLNIPKTGRIALRKRSSSGSSRSLSSSRGYTVKHKSLPRKAGIPRTARYAIKRSRSRSRSSSTSSGGYTVKHKSLPRKAGIPRTARYAIKRSRSSSKSSIRRRSRSRKKLGIKRRAKRSLSRRRSRSNYKVVRRSLPRKLGIPRQARYAIKRKRSKSKVRIHLEKGGLSKYITSGCKYSQMTPNERRQVIHRAISAGEDPHTMFKRLNALVVMRKNKIDRESVRIRKLFLSDRNWVKTNYL